MATPVTLQKRQDFSSFIAEVLSPHPAVQGIVGIGSIASGHARPDSDIDAVIFLEPYDLYVVPAESFWYRPDGTFHSIFNVPAERQPAGLFLDMQRLALNEWSNPAFAWPEGRRAELADGLLAYDRTGAIERLLAERTAYPEDLRIERLDEAVTWLDQHLGDDGPEVRWQSLAPAHAHDRLQAAYTYLVQALFAYNRRWQPWRNREMSYLLRLPWLPANFAERVLPALNAPSLDRAGYNARVTILRDLFAELLTQLLATGVYTEDPVSESFIRRHPGPGWAWNMNAWNTHHTYGGGTLHG